MRQIILKFKKNENRVIALILLVMALLGLAAARDYGVPLDEAIEMSILTSNMKEYAMHIPGRIGDKLENKFSYVVPISESEEKDHGISAYYAYVPLHLIADDARLQKLLWHAYTFLLFMLGCLALYGIVKELFGSRWQALFASLMLYLSPRMFAEGHYNNKDIVVMVFALLTLYFGLKMIMTDRYAYAALFALSGAVAANTKISGAWFFGITGIAYLIILIRKKALNRHNIMVGVTAIIIFASGYVLLTPAMWQSPVEFIKYIVSYAADFDRWDNNILFEGNIYKYSVNPPPRYYLLKMILITTPVYILVLNAAGTALTAYRVIKSRGRDKIALAMTVALLLWLFPLAFAVISGTRVYNGWRHFYFIYGPMLITCAYAVNWIVAAAKKHSVNAVRVVCLAGAIAAAASFVGIAVNHPRQFAYFNILAGGNAEDDYEMDYWMVSTREALLKLYEQHYDGGRSITVASLGRMNVNALGKALAALPADVEGAFEVCGADEAQYLFINPYGLILDESVVFNAEGKEKELSLSSYGNEIAAVYKMY